MARCKVSGSRNAAQSRHIEAQADEEGARIMAATGQYNPYGMVWFFQIMSETYGPGQNSWLRDHPLDIEVHRHRVLQLLETGKSQRRQYPGIGLPRRRKR